jgi:hypothetical protein
MEENLKTDTHSSKNSPIDSGDIIESGEGDIASSKKSRVSGNGDKKPKRKADKTTKLQQELLAFLQLPVR